MALEQLEKLQKEVKRSRRSRSRHPPREHETSGGDSSDNRGSDSEEKDQTPDDIRHLATRNATQGMLKHRAAGSSVEQASLKVLNELLDKEFPDTANEAVYTRAGKKRVKEIQTIEQDTKQLANIEALLQQVRANLEDTDGMHKHHMLGVEVEIRALLQAARATAYKGQADILTVTWTHGNLKSLQTLTSSVTLLIRDALKTNPR